LLQIFQIDGKKVCEHNLSNKIQHKISLNNFQNGVYLIVVFNKEQKETRQLIIAK
jgi:hypothetical protein